MLTETTVTEITNKLKTLTLLGLITWKQDAFNFTTKFEGDVYKVNSQSLWINEMIVSLHIISFHDWIMEYVIGDNILAKLDDAIAAYDVDFAIRFLKGFYGAFDKNMDAFGDKLY